MPWPAANGQSAQDAISGAIPGVGEGRNSSSVTLLNQRTWTYEPGDCTNSPYVTVVATIVLDVSLPLAWIAQRLADSHLD